MPITEPALRVGREVRAQMVRSGTKQAQIAEVLGLSQTAVSRRLTGEVPFDVDELQAIAELLGVAPSTLLVGLEAAAVT